ncbi:hypothetical protein FRC07_011107 [Ceratobasidium sp. 392]|nr:hypothetical protein FRC07_011107 [Ceratobasidium sp. 392]
MFPGRGGRFDPGGPVNGGIWRNPLDHPEDTIPFDFPQDKTPDDAAPLSPDERVEMLKQSGCTIVSHILYDDAMAANQTGSDPLKTHISDGFYRIVQYRKDKTAGDAVAETDAHVQMEVDPQLHTRVWRFTRQYGIENAFTIVPQNVPTDSTAWFANHGRPVTKDKIRIEAIGADHCWQTERGGKVVLAKSKAGLPPPQQLYELVEIATEDFVTYSNPNQIFVEARNATVVKKLYFGTPQLDAQKLSRYISFQLETNSRDQGWASEPQRGLWSWFDLAIFTRLPSEGQDVTPNMIKSGPNGKPLTWMSHKLPLTGQWEIQQGIVFGKDHELWKHLEPGDYVGVLACAQYAYWKAEARNGTLMIQEMVVL